MSLLRQGDDRVGSRAALRGVQQKLLVREDVMALTKDQISDLRSHLERVVLCELGNERTKRALEQAQGKLDTFLWALENDK